MKNTLIVLSFVASMLLLGCGCDRFKKSGGDTPVELPKNNDKGIAFEVFQRIPKEDLYEAFQTKTYTCPEDCRRHFGDNQGNDKDASLFLEEGNHLFTLDCFPFDNGGWLALLVNEGCFDGCKQTVKTYLYKDGVLNYTPDVLPTPTMDEMVVDPFLVFGISEEEIGQFKSEWEDRYLYQVNGDDTLSVRVETLNFDEMFENAVAPRHYVWNGERFAPIATDTPTRYNIIDRGALGNLRLGDPMPASVADFSRQELDEGILFTRNGDAWFKLVPDEQGRIDAIDVLTPYYAYCRGRVGDTLNKLLYKGGAENRAFFKNGRFVVTEESEYDDNWIDYAGPFDAINGTFVEGPIESPKFKPDATVQYIHIYKHYDWEHDTCDMRALREAIADAMLDQGDPTYGINDFEYYRELYNEKCEGWCDAFNYYLHCYPLKSGGFKVYETANWQPGWEEDEVNGGYSKFSAYIYKNGQLTEVEPESELNGFPMAGDGIHFSSVIGVYFYDRTITVATGYSEENKMQGVEFTWDGTKMRKTYEGMFEN